MTSRKLRNKIKSLYRLARIQRVFRIILRSAWLGGMGYLFGWGTNALWGWFTDSTTWLALGISLAAINFLTILYRPVSFSQFIWNLDRKMGLNEQLSAASEIDAEEPEIINSQLIEESLELLPDLRKRISSKGWRLRGEFEALLIVLILIVMVFISGLSNIPSFLPGGLGFLPGLGSDPSSEGIFPSGYPGVSPGEADQLGIGQGDGDSQESSSDLSSQELGEIGDVLSEMGENLEENASTSEFGQSLQRGDFDQAANELSDLTENLDELSEETKQDIEESFMNAADQLQKPGQQELADALRAAADTIQSGGNEAKEKLDELAAQIDSLDSQQDLTSPEETQPNFGVGEPEYGEADSFERILGDGQTIDLNEFDPSSTLQQSSGDDSGEEEEVISGDYNRIRPVDDTVIQEMIDPYILPWDMWNVVTAYFAP